MRNFDFSSSKPSSPVVMLTRLQTLVLIYHACGCTLRDANEWVKNNLTTNDDGKYSASDVGDLINAYFNRKTA